MIEVDEATRKELTKNIIFVNDETWPEYTSQDKLTLLHFLSSVDLVSRDQIPMIREFAAEYGDKYNVCVLDAGLCPNACEACRIQALPTVSILRQNILLAAYQGKIHVHDFTDFALKLSAWQQMDLERQIEIEELD